MNDSIEMKPKPSFLSSSHHSALSCDYELVLVSISTVNDCLIFLLSKSIFFLCQVQRTLGN